MSRFRLILFSGIALRLLIAPFFAHPFDIQTWFVQGENYVKGILPISAFLIPYSYSYFLFAIPAYELYSILPPILKEFTIYLPSDQNLIPRSINITVIPGMVFDLIVKIPLILSDIAVFLIIYTFVKKSSHDERLASSAAALWFLNPIVIWVSSGWGMFDTIPALFSLFCLCLLYERKIFLAGVVLALTIAMKYYAVILIVPATIIAWKRGGLRPSLLFISSLIVTSSLLYLSTLDAVLSNFVSLTIGRNSMISISNDIHYSGLSFWSAVTMFVPYDQTAISFVVLSILLGTSYWYIYSKVDLKTQKEYALSFALPLSMALMFYRFVGENFIIWILPFSAIMESRLGHRLAYWVTTLLAFLSSVTSSIIVFYLLPLSPWIGYFIREALGIITPYRVQPNGQLLPGFTAGKVYLATVGTLFFVSILALVVRWIKFESEVR